MGIYMKVCLRSPEKLTRLAVSAMKLLFFCQLVLFQYLFAASDVWTGSQDSLTMQGEFVHARRDESNLRWVTVDRYDMVGSVTFLSFILSKRDQVFVEEYIAAMEVQSRAVDLADERVEQNFIHKNKGFEIFQVLDYGVLATFLESRYNSATNRYETYRGDTDIYIYGDYANTIVDNEIYYGPLFWAGTYSYRTKSGSDRTIRAYAVDKETAINVWTNSALPKDFRIPNRTDYNNRVALEPSASSENMSYGSGFAVSEDGLIVTNAHVVEGASRIKVYFNDLDSSAKLVAIDTEHDLAILKTERKLHPIHLDVEAKPKPGDEVFVAGFPNPSTQGRRPKLTKGIISATTGLSDDPTSFQISAPIQPGNSGSPLLDERNNVIGVVNAQLNDYYAMITSGSVPQGVNYAVKLKCLVELYSSNLNLTKSIKSTRKPLFGGNLEDIMEASICLIESYYDDLEIAETDIQPAKDPYSHILSFSPRETSSIRLNSHGLNIPETHLFSDESTIMNLVSRAKEKEKRKEEAAAQERIRLNNLDHLAKGITTGMTIEQVREIMLGKEPDENKIINHRLMERYGNTWLSYYPIKKDASGKVTIWETERIKRP